MIDKICPIMSRPQITDSGVHIGLARIPCLQELCLAWCPAVPEEKMKGDSWNALVEYIEIERVLPHDIAEEFCRDIAKGHCKLIEKGLK